jgi:hypothetical protein
LFLFRIFVWKIAAGHPVPEIRARDNYVGRGWDFHYYICIFLFSFKMRYFCSNNKIIANTMTVGCSDTPLLRIRQWFMIFCFARSNGETVYTHYNVKMILYYLCLHLWSKTIPDFLKTKMLKSDKMLKCSSLWSHASVLWHSNVYLWGYVGGNSCKYKLYNVTNVSRFFMDLSKSEKFEILRHI